MRKLSTPAGAAEWKNLVDSWSTYFDIFQKFPSAKVPLDQLLTILPAMKPRLYSIANSPFLTPGKLDLTIVINKQIAPATKEEHVGICTKYIAEAPVGKRVACNVVCGTFKFSEDEKTPMVMVGLGTGIAPIRSFCQDKLYKKQKGIETGPMIVFYGCRHEKEELFYKEDWAHFKKEGVLTELIGAFQFDAPHYPPKMIFVSHKMEEKPEILVDNLQKKGGYFYMCGPAVATPGIQKALKDAMAGHGKLGEAKAAEWFDDLMNTGRYSEESY